MQDGTWDVGDEEDMIMNKILGFGNGVLIENPPSVIGCPPFGK